MSDFDLVPFDRESDAQKCFVYGTARRSLAFWPYSPADVVTRLKLAMARPGVEVRIVRPRGMDTYVGWVAVRAPDHVVYGYVKHAYRRLGVWSTACIELGVEFLRPTGCALWTPSLTRIVRDHGYPLYHDLDGAFDES